MAEPFVKKLETILVVDDCTEVLDVVTRILRKANFSVLQATTGDGAIKVSTDFDGEIDLVLSDVQMPGMSGPDLGKALKRYRPNLRVMLMSGMGEGNLLVLNYGWAFIEKPFVTVKLLRMVNAVLHTADRSQGTDHYDTQEDAVKVGYPIMPVVRRTGTTVHKVKVTAAGRDECPIRAPGRVPDGD